MIKDGLLVTASNLAYYKKRGEMLGILSVRYSNVKNMHCTFIVVKDLVEFQGAGEPRPELTNKQRQEVMKRLNQQLIDFKTRDYFHPPQSITFVV